MKCAMELLAEAAVNKMLLEAERQEREEKEKQKREKEKQEHKKLVYRRTYLLLEEIEKRLERRVKYGDSDLVLELEDYAECYFNYYNNFCEIAPMFEEKVRYADGRKSYYWDFENKSISLDLLKEELEKSCFTLEIERFSFWSYGYGYQNGRGIKIIIKPAPQCLEK